MRQFSPTWRVLRLVLMALVVLAPTVGAEPRHDRIALGEGGRGKVAPEAAPLLAAPAVLAPRSVSCSEVFRVAPRPAPVARYLLHRALLN